VVDLFSGAGGASAGFAANPRFSVVAAADAQLGKPSSPRGSLGCNETYEMNIGIRPAEIDLGSVSGPELRELLALPTSPEVLIACPPCTGFSRTLAGNHLIDDPRNSLVTKVADFAKALKPQIVVMENARELLMGRFSHHFEVLRQELDSLGYAVSAQIHVLTRFGLPQIRERAIIIAVRRPLKMRTLEDLWDGYSVDHKATHVRRAIWNLPEVKAGGVDPIDPMHAAPSFARATTLRRIQAIPHDGGSWRALLDSRRTQTLMTPTMTRLAAAGKLGSFPDVYGRLAWDRPAPTIKRESGHVGNGRYVHPEQDRLFTVREAATLQGFPDTYVFAGGLANRYRHVGDAVPPLIANQIAGVCQWILTGQRPPVDSVVLQSSHLTSTDFSRS